ETTGGTTQGQPTDDQGDQPQHSGRGGPESLGGRAVNRGGGWLGKVRGHQHGVYKPPEQGSCSQEGENKSEDSFHRLSVLHMIDYLLIILLALFDFQSFRVIPQQGPFQVRQILWRTL
ncbi:MAG TPA: hypothetical protein VFB12_08615, partial [Ktedonobacteraceae bacterium]|nr:hypothetical protein [Ktedonobacteraceae bacterium]